MAADDEELNPTIRRALGEAALHDARALEHLDAPRRSRTVPKAPRAPDFDQLEDEITGIHEKLDELGRRPPLPSSPEINVNVHLDSGKKSDPPESVRSMFSKKHLPRTVASIVIAAGAVAAAIAQACQGVPHP